MRKGKRMLMAVACCIFALSLSTAARALAPIPEDFISKNVGGKRVTCSGTISQDKATAMITSKTLPGKPIMPDEAYVSHVWVAAFDTAHRRICGSDNGGTVSATTKCEIDSRAYAVEYTYSFQSEEFGPYMLYY